MINNRTLARRPSETHRVRYEPNRDSWRQYVSDSPSPQKMAAILQQVDQGDVFTLMELTEEMEAKDAHLQGVASTRRRALTALDWEIEPPDPDTIDESQQKDAIRAADFCRKTLAGIDTFDATLEHLASAIGPGVAVVELIWKSGRLIETVDVPGHRLFQEPRISQRIRVETDADLVDGMPTRPAHKWIVYTPNSKAGFPFRSTITRAVAWLWVMKHYAAADWSGFLELFGIPTRVAKWGAPGDKSVDTGARNKIIDMLKNMGSDGWALFPSGIELEMMSTDRGTEPFSAMIEWIERKESIIYLGQTLTTEPAGVGSWSLGKVHDNVRADLTLSDSKNEARTIRQQLFAPLLQFGFPGRDMPVPVFKRIFEVKRDIESERLDMEQVRAAREAGLELDQDEVYERLGFTRPEVEAKPDEERASRDTAATINELTLGIERAVRGGDLQLVNALRRRVGDLLKVSLADLAVLPTMPGDQPENAPETDVT